MSTAECLTEVRTPPYDPYIRILDPRVGWSMLSTEGIEFGSDGLSLTVDVGTLPDPLDAAGTFGGLRLPQNTAVDRFGRVWLLDSEGRLRILDPCTCTFQALPCAAFSVSVSGAWSPALAVIGNSVYVMDPNDSRIVVLHDEAAAIRQVLTSPPGLENPWTPTSTVLGPDGRIWTADPTNGVIVRTSRTGRFVDFSMVGTVVHLAVGSSGSVYASDGTTIKSIDPSGLVVDLGSGQEALIADFEPSVGVDPVAKLIDLGSHCESGSGVFDFDGSPSDQRVTVGPPQFVPSGVCVLGPFDSRIDDCVWDRVTFLGEWPERTVCSLSTYSASVERPAVQMVSLPQSSWTLTGKRSGEEPGDEWDAMVKSQPGRYLWLMLTFTGTGTGTPTVRRVVLDYPRNTYRQYLPEVYSSDPVSAEFLDRFVSVFERTLRALESRVDGIAQFVDPMSAPWGRNGEYFRWLSSWTGFVPYRSLSQKANRELLSRFGRDTDWRGTKRGLHRTLCAFLGLEGPRPLPPVKATGTCRPARATCPPVRPEARVYEPPPLILEHFKLRRWMELASGTLGSCAVLWGRSVVNRSQLDFGAQAGGTRLVSTPDPYHDPFLVFAHRFTVFVPASLAESPSVRAEIVKLVEEESPAGTLGTVTFVEPEMRVGTQSMIGYDTVIGRLREQSGSLGEAAGPLTLGGTKDPAVGAARVGSKTVLN